MIDIEEMRRKHLNDTISGSTRRDTWSIGDCGSLSAGTFRALLDELTALRAANQWLPIEDAPRDGTRLLAWAYLHNDGGPYYEDRRSFMGEMPRFYIIHWQEPYGWVGWISGSIDGPTHYRPLPPPPQD